MADRLREPLLEPLGLEVSAPAGVALYLIGDGQALYNFHDRAVEVRLGGRTVQLEANGVVWR